MLTGQSTLIVIPEQTEDDVCLAYGFDISTSRLWFWYHSVIRDSVAKCPIIFRCQGKWPKEDIAECFSPENWS